MGESIMTVTECIVACVGIVCVAAIAIVVIKKDF